MIKTNTKSYLTDITSLERLGFTFNNERIAMDKIEHCYTLIGDNLTVRVYIDSHSMTIIRAQYKKRTKKGCRYEMIVKPSIDDIIKFYKK